MRYSLFAVDPGLQGTGMAFWANSKNDAPTWVDVLNPRGTADHDWVSRAYRMASDVAYRVSRASDKPVHFVCELMEMHQTARAAMMWKGGDLQRTLVFIGMLSALVQEEVADITLVKPSEWKGQLPKPIVEARIRRKLGENVCSDLGIKTHAWDAVGIGLWKLGRF